jgi:ABC-type lipoprotein export system ATPase subunit
MSLATLEGIRKSYRRGSQTVDVLQSVDLELPPGTFAAIQGHSGCGKSTMLLILGGLLRPDAGNVIVADKPIYELSPDRRARFRAEHIGFIFQQFHLVPYLNVEQNILAAAMGVGGVTAHARKRAGELIERFGLQDRRRHAPGQLSTGERQRAALARALLNQPSILLADEPTGNLDPDNTSIVLEELTRFAENGGCVLLVTHAEHIAQAASVRYAMSEGRLLQTADTT